MTTASSPADDEDFPAEQRNAHNEIFRAADAVNASLAGLWEPQREMARIVRESIAPTVDVSRFVCEARGPHQTLQNTMREIFAEQHRAVFAPMESVLAQIRAEQQEHHAAIARMANDLVAPRLDTSFLDAVLRDTAPWQSLSDSLRNVFADVLDGARVAVETGEEPDVPEEMVTELEEQAAQFAASARGPIPAGVQKYMFAVYVAATVWTALMYLSISSDTANALIDEATQQGELAVLVFTAACYAWDRKQRNDRYDD